MDYIIAGLHYLGRVLQEPPDAVFLTETASLSALLPCPLSADPEDVATEAAADHLRLFSGPDPLTPPWESVWREKDKLLFGETTAQIARLYADWGLEIQGEGHAPQDHLGLELSFLAWLLECALNDMLSLSGMPALSAARMLMEEHILQFAPQLLAEAQRHASSDYYRQICECCQELIKKTVRALVSR